MTLFGRSVYIAVWFSLRVVFTIIWRLKICGVSNIPKKTGAIIASNHLSMNDPPLVGCSIPRIACYMAKKELIDIPVLGWLLRQVNSFPVDRSKSDLRAIRMAVRLVSKNNIVVMFPQGTRKKEEDVKGLQFKRGIGIISCLGQVPIIPCLVSNSNRLKGFKQLVVSFGEPIYPPENYSHETYEELASKAISGLNQLAFTKKNAIIE